MLTQKLQLEKFIAVLALISVTLGASAKEISLAAFVGNYQKVSGVKVASAICDANFTYSLNSAGDLLASQANEYFMHIFSFPLARLNGPAFGCVNKGDPLHNTCFKEFMKKQGELTRDYLEKGTIIPSEKTRTRTIVSVIEKPDHSGTALTLTFIPEDASKSEKCEYLRVP